MALSMMKHVFLPLKGPELGYETANISFPRSIFAMDYWVDRALISTAVQNHYNEIMASLYRDDSLIWATIIQKSR